MITPATDVSLKELTTLRIGGPASYYAVARCEQDIHDCVLWAHARNLEVFVLGRGSNILVSDRGWKGLVIDVSRHFSAIRWEGEGVECEGGASVSALVKQSVDKGFCGVECLAGIPGTIGGAIIMNAGAFGQEISDCLERVDVLNRVSGERVCHERAQLQFGYRTSSLKKDGSLILGGRFRLTPCDSARLFKTYSDVLARRREKQPLDQPNCGSVFKRPKGHFAGTLIEEAGLKGLRVGDACVSDRHANFIVNTANARAEDVRALIGQIQRCVFEHAGVLLEPEVVFVGDFDTPLVSEETS